MKTRLMVLTSLVLVLAFSLMIPASYAYDCGKSKGHGSKGLDDKIFHKAHFMLQNKEELGLSDAQVKKIKDLKIKTKKDKVNSQAAIELLAIDIKTELWEDTINVTAVNALIDKKYDLKKAKAKSLLEAYISLKDILTEEQKKTLKALK